MKKLLIYILFSIILFTIKGQNITVDTLELLNNELLIETIDYENNIILVQIYNSDEIILEEQIFEIVDSVKCYDIDNNKYSYIFDTKYLFSDENIKAVIKIGDWKFYNSGKLNRIVNYSPLAFRIEVANCNKTYEENKVSPCSGSTTFDFGITKMILYENDTVTEVQEYKLGILKSIWRYDNSK